MTMVLDELLNLLSEDTALVDFLKIGEIKTDAKGNTYKDPKIYPFGTQVIQDCIWYNFTNLSSDKLKEQNRFSVTCISQDIGRALQMMKLVKDCLLTLGDEQRTNDILAISLNGGSDPMENIETGTIHIKANFIVKNIY